LQEGTTPDDLRGFSFGKYIIELERDMPNLELNGKLVVSLDEPSKRRLDELTEQTELLNTRIDSITELSKLGDGLRCSRNEMVRDFFVQVAPNQEKHDRPTVPAEDTIRLRVRIDAEEFVEKLNAVFDDPAAIAQMRHQLKWFDAHSKIRSDLHARLPELADALADQAYTNEGFAIAFGIDLDPVFGLVHRANLTKKGGPIVAGKTMKPEGWKAPDVAGELQRQGWEPSVAAKVWHGLPVSEPGPAPERCELHGVIPTDGFPCGQCEDPRYPGTEITALADLAKFAEKVQPTEVQMSQRHAIPIDRTLWNSDSPVDIGKWPVKIGNIPVFECKTRFFGKGAERRCLIEFTATDAQFGLYERLKQDEQNLKLSIASSHFGMVRIASVARGQLNTRPNPEEPQTYTMQIEFVRIYATS
jgi:predicted HAD superfamily Cof-like phosphohydrolase